VFPQEEKERGTLSSASFSTTCDLKKNSDVHYSRIACKCLDKRLPYCSTDDIIMVVII